eukprot:4303619-Amphidinium_carterae.1
MSPYNARQDGCSCVGLITPFTFQGQACHCLQKRDYLDTLLYVEYYVPWLELPSVQKEVTLTPVVVTNSK